MVDACQGPEGRVGRKASKNLPRRRLLLDLVAIADNDGTVTAASPALIFSIMLRSVQACSAPGAPRNLSSITCSRSLGDNGPRPARKAPAAHLRGSHKSRNDLRHLTAHRVADQHVAPQPEYAHNTLGVVGHGGPDRYD